MPLRINAGKFGSRHLKTLKGSTTRPTSDKIREAVFNRLGPFFTGGQVLDLFSGSGAVALESLSRGFDEAVMIEKDRRAYRVIEANIKSLGLKDVCQLIYGDTWQVLETLSGSFHLIYVDPPYAYEKLEDLIYRIIYRGLLHPAGDLVIETDALKELKIPESLELVKKADYKASQLWYLRLRQEV